MQVFAGLPFELHFGGFDGPCDPPQPCKLSTLWGAGTVPLDALEDALNQAGIQTDRQGWSLADPPTFPPPAPQTGPLRAELVMLNAVSSGTPLDIAVPFYNISSQAFALQGDGRVEAMILGGRGEPVRWYSGRISGRPGRLGSFCPANDTCRNATLTTTAELDLFNPRLPLPAGEYQVLVNVQGMARAGDQPLNLTFPPRPLKISP